MKKWLLISFLSLWFVSAKAFFPFHDLPNGEKRFRVGVSFCPISITKWKNTDSLMMLSSGKVNSSKLAFSYLNQFGVTFGVRVLDDFYIQTGGCFLEHNIKELADGETSTPKGVYKYTVSYSYRSNYIQVPLSVTYCPDEMSALYLNFGLKANFISYEQINGYHITSFVQNYSSYSGTPIEEMVNKEYKGMKYTSMTPYVNVGGILNTEGKKIGFIYYGSLDFPTMYSQHNTITKFTFFDFSSFNFACVYNF